jgi:hypothetical protein
MKSKKHQSKNSLLERLNIFNGSSLLKSLLRKSNGSPEPIELYDLESKGETAPIMPHGDGFSTYDALTDSDDSHGHDGGFSDHYIDYFESYKGRIFAGISLVIYLALAVFAYSYWFERWTVIDSLYFAVCTFTTIGYGDLVPKDDAGRLFTTFFAIYGIFILGFFVSLIGEKLVEMHNQALQGAQDRLSSRVTGLFDAKEETTAVSSGGEKRLAPVILKTLLLQAPLLAIILFAALLLGHYQGWSTISSIYFGVVTSTTVGFGDMSVTGQWARAIGIVVLPVMVAVFCEVLSRIAGAYLKFKVEQQEAEFLNRKLTVQDLLNMDDNSDGKVVWDEFLVFMLHAMQKVDPEEITKLREIFDRLDTSGDGVLTREDLETVGA